eukprot:1662073-Alexandrium_andersonii.AAC.1
MSASLVGSEMCIRDRAKASQVRFSWNWLPHSDSSPSAFRIEPVVVAVLALHGDFCELSAMVEPEECARSRSRR